MRRAVALLVLLTACRDTRKPVEAAPPTARGPMVDSLPTMEPSNVEAPITYDLTSARTALEAVVPQTFGDIAKRIDVPNNGRAHFAFAAQRTPFRVRVLGDSIELTTLVEYQGRGWYKAPVAPEISASCGGNGYLPRLKLRLVSSVRLTRDWTLDVRTKLRELAPASDSARDACRVTFLKYDVTGRVLEAVRGPLEKKLEQVDQRLRNIDVRSRLDGVWLTLQKPIRVTDSLWLQLNPSAVRVSGLTGSGDRLIVHVGLTALPEIRSGPRPGEGHRPLPPLERSKVLGDHAHVLLEGRLDYGVATAILNKALTGKSFEKGQRTFIIQQARLYALGDGRVSMRVQFGGDAPSIAYLVGTPKFNAESGDLGVPDLDFDVASEDLLVRSAAWVARDRVRDFLRERAHWPATNMIEEARARAERAVNRELTRGVQLAGSLALGEVLSVRALQDAIVVRAHADGALRLDIDRELPVPKRVARQSNKRADTAAAR